ncbi:MAG TPA: PLP-dependent aminotransferase family protein [Vicinamibacterales bacterium]|nr:PLP-dependent aminotransferase family protein [Vicinamibacterales bacterium]
MRRSRGVLLPPAAVSRPRRADLHRALTSAMLDGIIVAGARLPSTRQAAADYGVSRGLMEDVYARLTDEGFLERGVGRGTFASGAVPRPVQRTPRAQLVSPALSRRGRALAANAACREPDVLRPFNAGIADAREFPWTAWMRIEARGSRELAQTALAFADPRGLPGLRTSIARYLAQFRGIRCEPDQIVVFNSAQQALVCLAVLLVNRGDVVWIEDPCYLGARAAFSVAGARPLPIPVDADGLCVDALVRRGGRARLGYVTPANQYPTGVALALERRIALLEWNASHGGWIIEDDYDGEFRYDGQPLTPLHALDTHGRTIYIGTLNKSMFVSLRLAFAVVPRAIVEPLANLRTQFDGFSTPVRQLAMSMFMDEGQFASHLRRMRAIYRAKRAALVGGLESLSRLRWTWPPAAAGMHLLLRHPDGRYVRRVARASGLDLALLSTYRSGAGSEEGLFLRFGALETAAIVEGASALSRAAGASLNAAIS